MNNFADIKNYFKSYYFWLLAWAGLLIAYVSSTKLTGDSKNWDQVIYFVQLAIDVCIGIVSFFSYKNKTDRLTRRFYFLIFLSVIPGLFANEVYNVLINILGISKISNNINLSWIVAYTCFLVIQICAWPYLYYQCKGKKPESQNWLIKFPYIQSAAIVLISLLSIVLFRRSIIADIGVVGTVNSLLETVLFIAISMCFSRTKNKSLIFLEMGFMLLIAFNLAHRFSYTTGHYFKTFDVVWLISLITIIFGFYSSWREPKCKVEFFQHNSLHTLASSAFMAFATLLLILFIMIDFVISSIAMNDIGYSNILPQNIPSMLIFSYSIALLISKFVANYLTKPIEKISKRVDLAYENQLSDKEVLSKKFKIYELDKLDKFILKIIMQLKIANRAKSDFLMQMSHDFRTPASGVSHLSKSILKKLDDPTLKHLQQLVVDSSERLVNFLDDLLDYSRLESGKYKINIEKFNVKLLINEIVAFVMPKINQEKLYLQVNLPEDDVFYQGDKLMVNRIILNVIANAIKFTHEGGVTISLCKKSIQNADWLIVRIQDTGIGIDKDNHKVIFEPFFRVKAEAAKYPGIGLGLSNVNLSLNELGGEIYVDSSLGKGAIFSIHLPVNSCQY